MKKSKVKDIEARTVVLAKLIKRHPEKETEYDKNMNMEYWQYQWSDGTLGQGSLYQTQIDGLPRQ